MRSAHVCRLVARRTRLTQLAGCIFLLCAITSISNGHTLQPWNSIFNLGSNHDSKVPSTTAHAAISLGVDRSREKPNVIVAAGPPLPEFNMTACMMEKPVSPSQHYMTTELFLAGQQTRLHLQMAKLSHRRPSSNDMTVVVTYDVARLYMLEGLCLIWGGAISAAIYQAVDDGPRRMNGTHHDEGLRVAKYRITDLHSRVVEQRMCMLDVLLFSEAVSAADPIIHSLFPVNALRNRAMLMVHTDLVLVLDGDLLPQGGIRAKFAAGTSRGDALRNGAVAREYHVLPAFDTPDVALAYSIAREAKGTAVKAFHQGAIVRFGSKNSRFPQGCTDYGRWVNATEQYPVVYCNRYEPWGIVSRDLSPWFDSRFRGYGRNKIMYASALNSSRFEFVIDPDTFVIHRPHPRSTAQRIFDNQQDLRVHEHIMALWQQQAAAGKFVPVVDDTTLRCKQQLPWWRNVAMHVGRQDVAANSAVKTPREV